jgi:hypothetical protein
MIFIQIKKIDNMHRFLFLFSTVGGGGAVGFDGRHEHGGG